MKKLFFTILLLAIMAIPLMAETKKATLILPETGERKVVEVGCRSCFEGGWVLETKKEQKKYGCRHCNTCSIRGQCMGKKRGNRYLFPGVHENLIDQMEQRVLENPELTEMRKTLVEHPFGTIKHWMDQGYFLTRGFEKVTGEMSLTALCYNIKRVLNIVNVKELMANLQAVKDNFIFILLFTQKIVKKTNNSTFKPIFSIQ